MIDMCVFSSPEFPKSGCLSSCTACAYSQSIYHMYITLRIEIFEGSSINRPYACIFICRRDTAQSKHFPVGEGQVLILASFLNLTSLHLSLHSKHGQDLESPTLDK